MLGPEEREVQWGRGSSSVRGHSVSPALHVAKSDAAEPAGDKALISMGVNLPIINERRCPDLLHKGSGDVSGALCLEDVFDFLPWKAPAGGWCPSQPCSSCPLAQEVAQAPWGVALRLPSSAQAGRSRCVFPRSPGAEVAQGLQQ